MAYRHLTVGHAVFVRWSRVEMKDFDTILALVSGVRARTGRDVLYVALQYDDYIDPDADVRKAGLAKGQQLAALTSGYYIVVAATGLKASLQRTLLRGLLVAARAAGVKTEVVHVADSLSEVFTREAGNLPCSVSELRKQLSDASMLA